MLIPIPTQKESKDIASPKKTASFLSIDFEESKSEYIGSLIIFIVMLKGFIKN